MFSSALSSTSPHLNISYSSLSVASYSSSDCRFSSHPPSIRFSPPQNIEEKSQMPNPNVFEWSPKEKRPFSDELDFGSDFESDTEFLLTSPPSPNLSICSSPPPMFTFESRSISPLKNMPLKNMPLKNMPLKNMPLKAIPAATDMQKMKSAPTKAKKLVFTSIGNTKFFFVCHPVLGVESPGSPTPNTYRSAR
jgi:hypothetical protein